MYFRLFYSLLFILILTLPSYAIEIIENNNYSARILRISNKYNSYPSISIYGSTVFNLAKKENAFASINAGFFNHSNLQTVSYVYKNGQIIANPEKNKQLINNKNLKGIINKIINNRVEFRVLKSGTKITYDISPHNKKIDKGFSLLHSVQAGPNLLPILEPEKEGFILKNKRGQIIRDGISFYNKASRSALGIDSNGNLILFAIYAKNKKGMTIPELSKFVKSKGAIKAMAFDGGSSVSLVWKENGKYKLFGNNNRIKSALIIKSEK
jgi:exopolysaccharide biosynthesis protein